MRHEGRSPHRFSAEGDFIERLEGEERQRLIPVEEILPRMNLKRTDLVLDLGAGTGYFTSPMAQRGASVVAIDIEPKMLQVLSARNRKRLADEVHPVRAEMIQLPFEDSKVDHVLAAFVYHEVQDQSVLLRECARVLKPSGAFTVIDFQKRETPIGPPVSERKTPAHVKRTAAKWFKLESSFETDVFYMLRFTSVENSGAPVGIRTRVPSSTGSDDRPLHYRGNGWSALEKRLPKRRLEAKANCVFKHWRMCPSAGSRLASASLRRSRPRAWG